MEQNIQQRIETTLQQGYKYDFDTFFKNGWELWKKTTLMMLGAILILAIPMVIIYMIAMPFLFGITSIEQFMDIAKSDPKYFQNLQKSPMYLLKQMGVTLIFTTLFAPIHGGCMQLCRDADKGADMKFGTIFSFYKGKYYGRLLLTTLAVSVLTNLLNIGLGFIPIIGPLINLGCVLMIYSYCAFVQPLIIFGDASIGEGFSYSFKLAGKKLGGILGLILLFGLLFAVGFCVCGVGALFTFAFLPVCNYLLYKYAVGFPEDDLVKEDEGNWQQQPPPSFGN
jgi:hypothetical protein